MTNTELPNKNPTDFHKDNLRKEICIPADLNDPLMFHSKIWYDYIKDNAEWIKTDYFDGQEFAEDFEKLGDKIKQAKAETLKKVKELMREWRNNVNSNDAQALIMWLELKLRDLEMTE